MTSLIFSMDLPEKESKSLIESISLSQSSILKAFSNIGLNISIMPPLIENCPTPSTKLAFSYPINTNFSVKFSISNISPILKFNINFSNISFLTSLSNKASTDKTITILSLDKIFFITSKRYFIISLLFTFAL